MLDWLNDIMRALLTLVPRPVLIRSTHAGVMFTRSKARQLTPGLWWYWPIWSEVVQSPTVRQTLNLTYQSLVASDGESVVIAVTVVYRIDDIHAALCETDNILDTIQDVAHGSVKRLVCRHSSSELQAGRTETGKSIDGMLRRRIQTDLSPFGVRVDRAFIVEFSRPYFVRLMGDNVSSS